MNVAATILIVYVMGSSTVAPEGTGLIVIPMPNLSRCEAVKQEILDPKGWSDSNDDRKKNEIDIRGLAAKCIEVIRSE